MDILSNLKPAKGSVKKRKRVGRGEGSGHGKTSCRGENGQKSRSGHNFRAWFEGGQMPLQRRVPKFGFKNINRIEYQPVNIEDLVELSKKVELTEGIINPQILFENRLIRKKSLPVKILGQGELHTKLIVEAHAFSKSALEKIQAAGGKAIILN